MNHHKTTIHARCPYAPVWDYYTVIVETPAFLKCERLQEVCEEIRGKEMTQEQVFEHLIRRTLKFTGPPPKRPPLSKRGIGGSRAIFCSSDQWGDKTKRVVSPIRWMDNGNAFLALCLGREEPRRFELKRCSEVKLIDSDTVLMPMPIQPQT
jgi:hypothetical protein